MPLQKGQVLNDRYRIVRLLGQGGFGAVYRAWDIQNDGPVALKENLDASAEAQRQFAREASFLAQVRHPNLPAVSDYFFLPDQGQYLVMAYVEGENLDEMLERWGGYLPVSKVSAWLGQVAIALDYLHNRQPPVIHRDIKPANIKITPEGKAMLVDFGIAKVYDPLLSTTMGARAVTPGYSPPEQYGLGVTDRRSDIYALGATAYHLLTDETPTESVLRAAGTALPPPSLFNPKIDPNVEAAILKAMQMNPFDRFERAADFIENLSGKRNLSTLQAGTNLASQFKVEDHATDADSTAAVIAEGPIADESQPPAEAIPVERESAPAGPVERRPLRRALPWLLVLGLIFVLSFTAGIMFLPGWLLVSGTDTPTPSASATFDRFGATQTAAKKTNEVLILDTKTLSPTATITPTATLTPSVTATATASATPREVTEPKTTDFIPAPRPPTKTPSEPTQPPTQQPPPQPPPPTSTLTSLLLSNAHFLSSLNNQQGEGKRRVSRRWSTE